MSVTSVFTDYLKILTDYSERVDTGTATGDDFIDFQKLQPRIIKAYQAGYFQRPEYTALNTIYFYVKDGFRTLLKLDRY